MSESEKSNVSSGVQQHSEQIKEKNIPSPLPLSLLEEITQGVKLRKVSESEKSNVSSNIQQHSERIKEKDIPSSLPSSLLEEIAQGVKLRKVPESEKSNVSDKQSHPDIQGAMLKAFVDRNIGGKAGFNSNNSDNSVTQDEWDQDEREYEQKNAIEKINKQEIKANNIPSQQEEQVALEKLPSPGSNKIHAQSSSAHADILKASLQRRLVALNPDKAEKVRPSSSPNVSKKSSSPEVG